VGKILHVRLDDDIVQAIDHMVDVLRSDSALSGSFEGAVTRSTVVRYILRRATNEPQLQAMLAEEITVFHAMLAKRLQSVRPRLRQVLEEELLGAFDSPELPQGEHEDELSAARRARRSKSKV